MLKRILVSLDGSPLAECALPHAMAFARAFEAEVLLLRVLGAPAGSDSHIPDPLHWRFRRVEATAYLEGIARRFEALGIAAETRIEEGEPARAIVETANRWPADLVAMSTHGRGGLAEFPSGSTAVRVAARVGRSILLVTAREPDAMYPEPTGYRRILVPVDCSRRSVTALTLASVLGRPHDAEIVLAHVVPIPEMAHPETLLDAQDLVMRDRIVARNRRHAQRFLQESVRAARLPGVRARTRLELSAQVSRTLHRLVREEAPDLLVVNAHGCGLDGGEEPCWPFGSVSGHLLTYAEVPRLVYQDESSHYAAPLERGEAGRRPRQEPQYR